MSTPPVPNPLCGHTRGAQTRGYRQICRVCGSFWDLEALFSSNGTTPYREEYPQQRLHFDPKIGTAKAATLKLWLSRNRIEVSGKTVCEIGYGGGHCLQLLQSLGASVYGLEKIPACADHAETLGIASSRLLDERRSLPPLPEAIDLWLFLDSFEHLPDPAATVDWLSRYGAPRCRILLVAPRADSLSRRALGRMWPHKMPDHPFHWSRSGLVDFFRARGFALEREFYPLKLLSPGTVVAHFLRHRNWNGKVFSQIAETASALPFRIALNFGEMAAVFGRKAA